MPFNGIRLRDMQLITRSALVRSGPGHGLAKLVNLNLCFVPEGHSPTYPPLIGY